MQEYAVKMRNDLWSGLKNVYDGVSNGRDDISTVQVEHVVKNVMKETDQLELDYIFKNVFRLDPDGSGGVSFNQFANFFLKRHCGQIALQRAHKKNLIGKGSQRKLNLKQFLILLNDAFSFLNVRTDEVSATDIFKQFDTDRDNHITYVEYFNFIDKYVCKSQAVLKAQAENRPVPVVDIRPTPAPVPTGRNYRSRMRHFLWETLRKLYNTFDYNGDGQLQTIEVKGLISDILKLSSKKDIDYILFTLFNLGQRGQVSYNDFCPYFVEHVGQLGLSQLLSRNPNMRKLLNRDQFVQLFKTSFGFLAVSRIHADLLYGFFAKIDTDRDGFITFQQYIIWLKDFLCPTNYRGDTYYFELDDLDLGFGNGMIMQDESNLTNSSNLTIVRRQAANILRVSKLSKYRFGSIQLAKKIRANIFSLLSTFDKNYNKQFEEDQIIDILRTLLNENEHEIPYVIKNVFRYDKDDDKHITFSQMANFLLEIHCGEMAIQRLHLRGDLYKLGHQRMMNVQQFIVTLTDALRYLKASASDGELRQLFSQIDLDRDGLISYKEYFEFLKLYFGSESLANLQQNGREPILSLTDEFAKWLTLQSTNALRGRFQPSNNRFDANGFALILKQIFREFDPEVNYALENLFRILFNPNSTYTDDDIRKLLLLIHIGLILLLRGHTNKKFSRWNDRLLNQRQFTDLVLEATQWAQLPFDASKLGLIFAQLDTNRDGFITYLEYLQFLMSIIGLPFNSDLLNFFNGMFAIGGNQQEQKRQTENFYDRVWNELRQLFNAYLKGGLKTLGRDDIKLLIGDILKEQNQQQLDYVFWNYFRLDKDGNNEVEFEQFAPFILNHATEIALQRFHSLEQKGKNSLTVQQFVKLASMAFSFLRTIPKEQPVLKIIYNALDTDRSGDLSYKQYLMWAKTLVNRYK